MAIEMKTLYKLLGISHTFASHTEKIISAVGGFLAILCILFISQWAIGSQESAIIVASMGASAVLLFAVPHGQLSQPWSVLGGHVISAIIGVTCFKLFPNEIVAASLAVGIAIGAMYYLHCIHPPGGATALSAVIGNETVHELGYHYVITPILINVLIILLIAVMFNYLFHWRRYPSYLQKQNTKKTPESHSKITHEDFTYALSQIDSFIDINEHDLLYLYELITKKSQECSLTSEELVVGQYYSNGEYGNDWAVRQIVDVSDSKNEADEMVIYKIIAGNGRRNSGYSSKHEFLHWAKYEVVRDEENWKKKDK